MKKKVTQLIFKTSQKKKKKKKKKKILQNGVSET